MILYYVRHGDPIYNPNQLTPLGERQAEAVAKRLAVYGIDRIYSSPSRLFPSAAQSAPRHTARLCWLINGTTPCRSQAPRPGLTYQLILLHPIH